ncbi:MAG: insulinase family protein [Anaerolineae bacterium]|nr:insulinase family protein [Anaerolineae bacterium]
MEIRTETLPGPQDIARHELANGIVVLVRENLHVRSVVITGALDAGSIFETPDTQGVASFTASMLLRGTHTRNFDTIHEMLEGSGAKLAMSSGRHTVGFSGKSLREDLPMLLDLLADGLRNPAFPADYVEKLRGQLVTNYKFREEDTRYIAGRTFRELAYPAAHPYSQPIDGTLASIETITRDHMIEFHRRQYGPGGMFIVVVGAVDTAATIQMIAERFADWRNPDQQPQPELPEIPSMIEVRQQVVPMQDKSQSDVVLGVPSLSRYADDWIAANIANSILGVFGMYGRIGAEVREKRGLAYYAYSRIEGGIGPGPWRVIAGVNPVNVPQTVAAIRDEIRRIITEPVTAEELADNKANFIGRLPLRLESNEGVAGSIVAMERYQLGLDYLQRYAAMVNAITVEDVLAAAQRYLNPDVYALAVAGPDIPAE